MRLSLFALPLALAMPTHLVRRSLQRQAAAPWGLARLSHTDFVYDKDASHKEDDKNAYYFQDDPAVTPTVYVLDTGVLVEHEELQGRAHWGKNFVNNVMADDNGHGTHIAGIIGGSTVGTARNAQIIAVKVLNSKRIGTIDTFVKAIDWVIQDVKDNKREQVIINYSAVGEPDDHRTAAIDRAIDAGILVVVAAGNSGNLACNYGPANLGKVNGGVISVMALNWTNAPADFTNWGSCGSVYAPGVDIYSIRPDSTSSYGYMSGTSNAAGYISGLSAYLWSLHPNLSRDEIKNLVTSGQSVEVVNNRPDTSDHIAWNYVTF